MLLVFISKELSRDLFILAIPDGTNAFRSDLEFELEAINLVALGALLNALS